MRRKTRSWENRRHCGVQLEAKRCRPEESDWNVPRQCQVKSHCLAGRKPDRTIEFADNGGRSLLPTTVLFICRACRAGSVL
ncbi:hypothetical protein GWI33_000212 [Rhynchophorus ferrugineus]|uniref:Uncharacterized protein n=1 Tax=Rhynchophorus ferrugineus TaxID=354439 RepID=A0A834MPQ8_RHYFE|nr:hypothetical protein GWI33_000212 [Rhynchophorus ferrugineus]